ncbi:MAG: hypothetical protein OER88_14020 [Planctomycetota bacterium]|nr:hypothetical protein [Planctomycetota bacterium]
MSTPKSMRFPKRVLKRYAEVLLRHIYQCGGDRRFVAVADIEEALGLERALIVRLCRTRLRGEVCVAWRLAADIENSYDLSALERHLLRCCYTEPHVRIRARAVRLTEGELVRPRKRAK